MSHETDERLELYALGRLDEPQVAAVEEHLLICALCQERLDDVESFAMAMHEAIASEPPMPPRTAWFSWLTKWPTYIWVPAMAALILAASLWMGLGRNQLPPLATLQLTAIRGDVGSVAPARETDIQLTDAPAGTALRAEVVDSGGGAIWNGPGQTIRITKTLAPGTYFARLYDASGKLLHEYGFRVRGAL
jgi:hypothetical protein